MSVVFMEKAFDEKVSSVFVVNSPFQVLCAITAIKNLNIVHYSFIACLNDDSRDNQMIQLLKKSNVHYQSTRVTFVNKVYFLFKCVICKERHYRRLFIGDVRCLKLYLIGIGLVSNHSNIVYLDDGIFSISYFFNKVGLPSNLLLKVVKQISAYRKIELFRNFYTIYDNLSDEVYRKWNVKTNVLNSLQINSGKNVDVANVVCIVGTNSEVYCSYLKLPVDYYYAMLENLFMYVRHIRPCCETEYYAHGRDDNELIKALCLKHGVRYILPSKMVELSLLEKKRYPVSIWGFTSSALYNLKRIYPDSEVNNIRFHSHVKNRETEEYDFLTSYYEKNNIQTKFFPFDI